MRSPRSPGGPGYPNERSTRWCTLRTDERVSTVERDGLVFGVLDQGPADGEPVVLLHGWPERATVWRHVAPLLNAAGYRTLAMDRRGFAPGARPTRRRDYR